MKPISEEEAVLRLKGKPVELVMYCGNADGESLFRCLNVGCGYEWVSSVYSVAKSKYNGCRKCAGTLKLTEEDIRSRLAGRPIELIDFKDTTHGLSTWRCLRTGCGHVWVTSNKSVTVSNTGCPKCASKIHLCADDVVKRLEGTGLVLLNYAGTTHSRSSTLRCLVDGFEWKTSLHDVFSGQRCPKCSSRLPVTEEDVIERLAGSGIELVHYTGRTNIGKSTFRCTETNCGHEWKAVANAVINGKSGCPACAEYGFNPGKPAAFYAYRIITRHNHYLGFGITRNIDLRNRTHQKSFRDHGATGELIFTYDGDGHAIQEIERTAIEQFEITNTGIPGFIREATLYADWKVAVLKSLCTDVEPIAISPQTM